MSCYVCNTAGHWARECPSKALYATCFCCGKRGHYAKDCDALETPFAPSTSCEFCGEEGHRHTECPTKALTKPAPAPSTTRVRVTDRKSVV